MADLVVIAGEVREVRQKLLAMQKEY